MKNIPTISDQSAYATVEGGITYHERRIASCLCEIKLQRKYSGMVSVLNGMIEQHENALAALRDELVQEQEAAYA